VTASVGSAGMPGLFGLLLLVEERVSAGALPLWVAVAALELVAAVVAWLLRRQGRARLLVEGCCPACLAAGALGSARLQAETRTAP
jgi:hypothetical protein